MKKQKQIYKTKEQLIEDSKRKNELNRKRTIIVDKFYPALIKATVSVDESKALINAMGTLLMEEVLKTMKQRKFSEIIETVLKVLTEDGERVVEVRELLRSLEGENLFVAREIIEGMSKAIEATITEEMRERKLDTLKPNWDKYLNN